MDGLRVGPGGWSHAGWAGHILPHRLPRGGAPELLARAFDALEVQSTFHATPRRAVVAGWREVARAHPDLRFTALAPRALAAAAPDAGEAELEAAARSFREGLVPLTRAGLLGAVVLPMPARLLHGPSEVRRLAHVASLLDGLPLVAELHHRSWWEPRALDALAGLGLSLAHVDLPESWDHPPPRHAPTGPIGYLRLHGRNADAWFRAGARAEERHDYLYAPPEVGRLARAAASIAREVDATYVIANNVGRGAALATALELRYVLGGERPVAAWPEVVAAFPHLARVVAGEGSDGSR